MDIIEKFQNPTYTENFADTLQCSTNFYITAFLIVFCPLNWSFLGRMEYKYQVLSKLMFGSRKLGNMLFAFIVFTLSSIRNYFIVRTLIFLPRLVLQGGLATYVPIIAVIIFLIGCSFVFGAYYRLGISGTYYGDHFGILMENRVVDFPFNVTDHPMYNGALTIFLGGIIYFTSVLGLVLLALMFTMYRVIEWIELPMTEELYSKDTKSQKTKKTN